MERDKSWFRKEKKRKEKKVKEKEKEKGNKYRENICDKL